MFGNQLVWARRRFMIVIRFARNGLRRSQLNAVSVTVINIGRKKMMRLNKAKFLLTFMMALGLAVTSVSAKVHDDQKDIVDTAVAAGTFKTLAAALEAAGLIDTLKGDGPFTVFAPTDEAFAKLPAGTVEALLKDKEKLKQILLYHVVPGRVAAKDVVNLKSAKTAQGSSIKIMVKDGKVMVDNAQVVKTDIAASNGLIHVIDSVILPK
jgi:uncharacterized surface protein with fasciclin (FAS1) repeats